MKNRDPVSRRPWLYNEPPASSLLAAPTASERERGDLAPRSVWGFFLPPPPLFPGRTSLVHGGFSERLPPPPCPASSPRRRPATHTHARTAGRHKGFQSRPLYPPQLPAQPLLQRSPSKDAYSSAPKGPHCCQLVTGRHRDSRLTAPAKQEKWTQWGARGPALFLSPPRLSPHKKYLSQRGFPSRPPNPTARACMQGHARRGTHGAERCQTCCERGAGDSRPAHRGGHQYLCVFLSPPPPSWSPVTNPPSLSSPG